MITGILEKDTAMSVQGATRPWHKVSTVLENAPSIEEALVASGMTWDVSLRKMRAGDIPIETHKAVMRSDSKDILGIVGNNYTPLQNKDAFAWFQPFIDDGQATLESAGSFLNGKRTFIMAKMAGDNMEIMEGDQVEKFLLLANSFDGSRSVSIGYTPIRISCNNSLTAALNSNQSQIIRVRHDKNVVENVLNVRETIDLVNKQFIATEEMYKSLTIKNINKADLEKYVKQVFSYKKLEQIIKDAETKENEKEAINDARKRLVLRVEEIFEKEPAKTTWNAYNAVNSYLNHERGKTDEGRYNSTWFGTNKKIDEVALQLAVQCYS